MIKQHIAIINFNLQKENKLKTRGLKYIFHVNEIPKKAEVFYQTQDILSQKLPQKSHHLIKKSILKKI